MFRKNLFRKDDQQPISKERKSLFKLGSNVVNGKPVPYVYSNMFEQEHTIENERIIIATSSHQIDLMLELSDVLPEPFGILYQFFFPHSQSYSRGRYQSLCVFSREQIHTVFSHFSEYFQKDNRHSLWLVSVTDSSMLVYDNHNLIYAYGPLEKYKAILRKYKFPEKKIEIPCPHVHMYNPELDEKEKEFMSLYEWKIFPLEESDDY